MRITLLTWRLIGLQLVERGRSWTQNVRKLILKLPADLGKLIDSNLTYFLRRYFALDIFFFCVIDPCFIYVHLRIRGQHHRPTIPSFNLLASLYLRLTNQSFWLSWYYFMSSTMECFYVCLHLFWRVVGNQTYCSSRCRPFCGYGHRGDPYLALVTVGPFLAHPYDVHQIPCIPWYQCYPMLNHLPKFEVISTGIMVQTLHMEMGFTIYSMYAFTNLYNYPHGLWMLGLAILISTVCRAITRSIHLKFSYLRFPNYVPDHLKIIYLKVNFMPHCTSPLVTIFLMDICMCLWSFVMVSCYTLVV